MPAGSLSPSPSHKAAFAVDCLGCRRSRQKSCAFRGRNVYPSPQAQARVTQKACLALGIAVLRRRQRLRRANHVGNTRRRSQRTRCPRESRVYGPCSSSPSRPPYKKIFPAIGHRQIVRLWKEISIESGVACPENEAEQHAVVDLPGFGGIEVNAWNFGGAGKVLMKLNAIGR